MCSHYRQINETDLCISYVLLSRQTYSIKDFGALELSFNLVGLQVRQELVLYNFPLRCFCLQDLPCLVSFRWGCIVEVWMKNILCRPTNGPPHFLACQEVLKWVWPSVSWHRIFFVETSTLQPHWKLTKYGRSCKQKRQILNLKSCMLI